MKLSTGPENFKGVVSDDLSFASVEIDKNYWLALPQWRNLCHRLSCDQPQPGSFFQRPTEAEKRDPGNEVDPNMAQVCVGGGVGRDKTPPSLSLRSIMA